MMSMQGYLSRGIPLDDMYTYNLSNTKFNVNGGGSDVRLSADGKSCVGAAKTGWVLRIIAVLLKI